MSKSLIAILHFNTTLYTDNLYDMLKPYERDDYDLVVIDNGSDPGKSSKYTTYRSEENTGYGGGLDMALQLFIDSKEYDSFTLLNSDLIIHGYNFIRELKKQLYSREDLMIVSPCVIQPERNQCWWKQMHCWNSREMRIVPFVDFQCALMKRQCAETIKSFGSRYGWVQDVVAGLACEKNNWKIGVCDWLPVVHIGNGTVKTNQDNPMCKSYNDLAHIEMWEYFKEKGILEDVLRLRKQCELYTYEPK